MESQKLKASLLSVDTQDKRGKNGISEVPTKLPI